jgi:hypothetical protein
MIPHATGPVADTHETADWMNRVLLGWHGIERAILERRDLPFGLSILAVREKK